MDKKKSLTKDKSAAAKRILEKLEPLYPDATTELLHEDPFELLIATILSAQCTDKRVNIVTPALFKRYRTAGDFAKADTDELIGFIRSTGFFNNKAKAIIAVSKELDSRFSGLVPKDLDTLVSLPGVGRKTANVVLAHAYGIPGVTVDTHVQRLSLLIGLSKHDDPVKIEFDIRALVPEEKWTLFSDLLIHHGRSVCVARKPRCAECAINSVCDYFKSSEKS
jgi:endonuclease III